MKKNRSQKSVATALNAMRLSYYLFFYRIVCAATPTVTVVKHLFRF